jgi:hypothetical protein
LKEIDVVHPQRNRALTRSDVAHALGDEEDTAITAILALDPTYGEFHTALAWALGESAARWTARPSRSTTSWRPTKSGWKTSPAAPDGSWSGDYSVGTTGSGSGSGGGATTSSSTVTGVGAGDSNAPATQAMTSRTTTARTIHTAAPLHVVGLDMATFPTS